MASIKLQTLTQPEKGTSGYTYNDLHLDLEYSYTKNNEFLRQKEIKDLVVDYDYAAIRNSIFNLFTTLPGQKILNPGFGINLMQFLFKPCDTITARQIARTIVEGINKFEPRVRLNLVEVISIPDQQQYEINLDVTVPQVGLGSFKLVGTLSNSGFFFNK